MLGWRLVKNTELEEVAKAKADYEHLWSERPSLDRGMYGDSTGAMLQAYPFHPRNLFQMALHVDALRIVIETLRREIFRSQIKVVEEFAYKCTVCGKRFKSKPEGANDELECDNCHAKGEKLVRPDYQEGMKLERLLTLPVNINGQSLKEVAKQVEWDVEVFDNGYMLLLKDYEIDPLTKKIAKRTIKEIVRGDPLQLFFIADAQGRLGYEQIGGNEFYGKSIESRLVLVCPRPEHRYRKLSSDRCTDCGAYGVRAIAVIKQIYSSGMYGSGEYYYIDGEVLHGAKYQPSLLYGYSPIYAIWQKAMTLYYQDRYALTYYDKQKSPNAILAVATKSLSSFGKAWDLLKSWYKEDPHRLHPLAIETERGGRNIIQYVDLMKSLADMQYIEQRNEFRRTIGAVYQVLPIFGGDLPTGWNNEGLQVMVTNRAVHDGQNFIEEYFLNKIARIMGVRDWRFEFEASESADKLRDLQIQQVTLANATQLKNLGFKIWFNHLGDLMHSKVPDEPTNVEQDGEIGFRHSNPVENLESLEGMPSMPRHSDIGGKGTGSPASGVGTSMSRKSEEGIVDELKKSMSEFDNVTILKSINTMREEAQRQVWQYGFEKQDQAKYIRDIIQMSFSLNLPKRVAKNNLISIGVSPEQADLIVKTEYQHALNRAKELAYRETDPSGTKYKYRWETQEDGKVCKVCDEIRILTSKGAGLDELKDVIKSVAKKYGKKANRMWHAHVGDRCEVVRMF